MEERAYDGGVIARGVDGSIIEVFVVYHVGIVQPANAEIMTIKEALSWMKQRNWKDATIETDSLLAIQALSSSLQMSSSFGLLVNDCREFLNTFINVCICYVPRSANGTTQCLLVALVLGQVVILLLGMLQ